MKCLHPRSQLLHSSLALSLGSLVLLLPTFVPSHVLSIDKYGGWGHILIISAALVIKYRLGEQAYGPSGWLLSGLAFSLQV